MELALAAVVACVALGSCKVEDPPPITQTWTDDFERDSVGADYYRTGGNYAVKDGALHVQGAYNHPLWLRKKLPRNVSIELDTWSNSKEGDIKVELFGDGRSHAHNKGAYTSTGYVAIMGGWGNSKSILARQEEHGAQLAQRRQPKVVPGKRYHWKIVRQGNAVTWYVDDMDTPFLTYQDTSPLEGPGHEYFGFDNWESDVGFDNLRIEPL